MRETHYVPAGVASEIYVMNADGSNQTLLTNNPERENAGPAWSPDSNRIAFASNRTGHSEIYVMNADGSNPIALTDLSSCTSPEWSPDGTKIVFTARVNAPSFFVMDADGSNQRRPRTRTRASNNLDIRQ